MTDFFPYSQSFLATLNEQAATCGYANYMEEFVTFPPSGLLPLPGGTTRTARGCDLWDEIFEATLLVNPAFDIYRVFDTVRLHLCGMCISCSYTEMDSSRSSGMCSDSREFCFLKWEEIDHILGGAEVHSLRLRCHLFTLIVKM